MLTFIEQILGSVLAFFYDVLTPFFSEGWGFGLAIIFLTIAINIVVFPLTLKQTRSTRAFSALQPKIKKIQAEFKDDKEEMQKRLMQVQKEAGASPAGCLLPLLVQMPIWFALFRLLRTPLVLDEVGDLVQGAAHAIDPLSALGMALQDTVTKTFLGMDLLISPSQALAAGGVGSAFPYLILMAMMIATQYVQQWHSTYGQDKNTGAPGAGATQAITKIMPLFIGFISYNFPAGLVLYWSTSNMFRLGQQVLIFKIDGRPPAPGSNQEPDEKKALDDPDSDAGNKQPQQGAANKRRRRRRR